MTQEQLYHQIRLKNSFLCIGLDPDMDKLPAHIQKTQYPLFEFCKGIIDKTHDLAIACKPNTAFFECHGAGGWSQLEMTIQYIRSSYPDIFVIADAKRGDIGNTASKYADAFFNRLNCDAVTLSPYMGSDSVQPYLNYPGKWAVLLALTSNPGAGDFQMIRTKQHETLFNLVLRRSMSWGDAGNLMYVIGATRANMLVKVREIVPDHFLLIPGVGAQGGSLSEVAGYGLNKRCGLIVNASRSIIYAASDENFAGAAREKASELQQAMKAILKKRLS